MRDRSPGQRLRLHWHSLWLDGWVKGGLFLALLALIALIFVLTWHPERHHPDGVVSADIPFIHDLTTDAGRSFALQVALPDGTIANLRTRSLVRLGGARPHACIERHAGESGTLHYRLARPEECATPADEAL